MNSAGMVFGAIFILGSIFLDCISNDPNNSQTDYDALKQFVILCYIASCLVSIMSMMM
jgi:hypothetical protein